MLLKVTFKLCLRIYSNDYFWQMQKSFLLWGFLFGVIAVIIGALGAHALKPHFSIEQQSSFETGIRYQMYHALLLILIANFSMLQSKWVLRLLVSGILCFSVSIYLLNLRHLLGIESLKFLGPITPIGGLLLISAWLILLYKTFKKHQS